MKIAAHPPAGLLIAHAHKKLRQLVSVRIAPTGLTSQQFWVLLLLDEGAVGSVQEVGRRIGVDKAAASRLADKLIARRWVRHARPAADRRRIGLELTAAGRKAAARMNRLAVQIKDEIERGLTDDDKRLLCGLLGRMLVNLDRALGP